MHQDELWQEYDRTGVPIIGSGHPKSYYQETNKSAICATAQVWLFRDTENGRELLFQHRSKTVSHHADQWDISAAGHINLGETPLDAAVREVREEIGVDIMPEKLIYVGGNQGVLYHSVHFIYLYDWTGKKDVFCFPDGEVSEVKWVHVSKIPAFVEENVKPIVANMKWYWDLLVNHQLKLL